CVGARIRPPRNRRLATVTFAPSHPAGIRADGLMRIAFPSADGRQWHRNACADTKSAGRLPLAGTAQGGRLLALPFSRLTAVSATRTCGTGRAHTIAHEPSVAGGSQAAPAVPPALTPRATAPTLARTSGARARRPACAVKRETAGLSSARCVLPNTAAASSFQ